MSGVDDEPMIPTPREVDVVTIAPSRRGRAWDVLATAGMLPEDEPSLSAAVLFQLADIERTIDVSAKRKARYARNLSTAGTSLTLIALSLAALAGVGGLNDLVGGRTSALVSLAAAVASALSAWAQSKVGGDSLRLEAQGLRIHADDVHDSVVAIVTDLPMTISELRSRGLSALSAARDGDPARQDLHVAAGRLRR